MRPVDYLKLKWEIWGIDAPIIAWLSSIGVVLVTLATLIWLFVLVYRKKRIFKNLSQKLDQIAKKHPRKPREGLTLSAYDEMRQLFENEPLVRFAWHEYEANTVFRQNAKNEVRVWAFESAEQSFRESSIVDANINRRFFSAIPGIITGVGLLATFGSILIALLDVKLENNRVQGLELLIQGLSGKFISSIAALLSASLYLPFEKTQFHKIFQERRKLVEKIDRVVPRLTAAQVLADLQDDIAEQSNAIRSFNAGLAPILRQSLDESMTPTLERMVEVIEDLSSVIRKSQSTHQDSMNNSLESVLRNVERSLGKAIENMGTAFTQSLSGGALAEFDKAAKSLNNTSLILESMNQQFQGNQQALTELITFANKSTTDQLNLGKNQIEDLTAVMKELMRQVNESTGSSVSTMAATLTNVIYGLSKTVNELNTKMTETITASSNTTTNAAKQVFDRTEAWSKYNASQLTELLQRHQEQVNQIKEVRAVLDTSLTNFNNSLTLQTEITKLLQKVSTDVSVTVLSIKNSSEEVKTTQTSLQKIATLVRDEIHKLEESNNKQIEVWRHIQTTMSEYEKVFGQVETTASGLLSEITAHLNNHVQISKDGYESLVKVADEHFKNANERLGASVNELQDFLEDLGETLAKAKRPEPKSPYGNR